jgi:hypothetical protein
VHVAVQPPGELGAIRTDGQQLPSHGGVHIPSVFFDGTHDAQYERKRGSGSFGTVLCFRCLQLSAEVRDDRTVEVTAGIVQCGGNALEIGGAQARQGGYYAAFEQ